MQIPAEALTAINAVIVNDEGGWKLISNPNDTDGGWTYAGITARTYRDYQQMLLENAMHECKAATYEQLKAALDKDSECCKQKVYEIYYTKYYLPLQKAEHTVSAIMLSCAINCGVATAIEILDAAVAHEETFAHHWLLHYADLVRKNAEAWRDYAVRVASPDWQSIELEKPKTLRAEFLAGWINRVEKYR